MAERAGSQMQDAKQQKLVAEIVTFLAKEPRLDGAGNDL
jgi:hypothetical protein